MGSIRIIESHLLWKLWDFDRGRKFFVTSHFDSEEGIV